MCARAQPFPVRLDEDFFGFRADNSENDSSQSRRCCCVTKYKTRTVYRTDFSRERGHNV